MPYGLIISSRPGDCLTHLTTALRLLYAGKPWRAAEQLGISLLARPEVLQFIFDLAGVLYDFKSPPVCGEQVAVPRLGEPFVDQYNDPPI